MSTNSGQCGRPHSAVLWSNVTWGRWQVQSKHTKIHVILFFFVFFFTRTTDNHDPSPCYAAIHVLHLRSKPEAGTSTVDGDTEQLSRANGPSLHCFNLICGIHRVLQHKPWSTNNYLVHISFKSNGQINPERIEPPLWLAHSVQDLSMHNLNTS